MRPVTSCAVRNASPLPTRKSATSVASSRPDAADFATDGRRCSVRTTAAVVLAQPMTMSSASKAMALSSCKSLLYPIGRPFIVVSQPARSPTALPDLPRTSSSGSGFFFCGIRLDPVATLSSISTKPNSSPGKQNQVLAQAAQVHHRHGARIEKGRDEVTIAGRVDAVGHDPRKAESIGKKFHVDVVRRSGDGAGTERHEHPPPRAPSRND